MAVTYPAGQTRTYTAADVWSPMSGPVLGGGSVSVAFALRTLTGETLTTVPATATTGANDWSAPIAFPATTGTYLLATIATDADGPVEVGIEQVTIRGRTPRNAITRTDLIERVASEVGDIEVLTATEDSAESVIIDALHLNVEAQYYVAREIVCTGGTFANMHQARRVASSSKADRSVTIDPPFPQPVHAGDRFIAVRTRGTGWTLDEYVRAINDAVMDAAGSHMVPVDAELPVTVNTGEWTATVTIPDTWSHLSGVDAWAGQYGAPGEMYRGINLGDDYTGRGAGPWRAIPRLMTRGARKGGYWLNGYDIEINGSWYTAASTTGRVKAYGYLLPEPLLNADDYTTVPAEWLVPQAAYKLLLMGLQRDPTREGLAAFMQRRADGIRPMIRTSQRANTVPLPG